MRKEDKKITPVEIQNKYILKYAKGPIEYSDDVKAALKSVFGPNNKLHAAAPQPKKVAPTPVAVIQSPQNPPAQKAVEKKASVEVPPKPAQAEKQVLAAPPVKLAEKVGAAKTTAPVEKQVVAVIQPKPVSIKMETPKIHAEMEILQETVVIIPAQNEGEEETPPPSPPPFDLPKPENEPALLPQISTEAAAPPPSPPPFNPPEPENAQAFVPQISTAAPPSPPPPPPQNFSKKIGNAAAPALNLPRAPVPKTPAKPATQGKSFIDELREKQAKKNASAVGTVKIGEETPKTGMESVQKPRRASPLDRFKKNKPGEDGDKLVKTPEKVTPTRSSSAAPSAPQNSRGFLAAIANQGKHLRSPEKSDDEDEDESPRQSAGK